MPWTVEVKVKASKAIIRLDKPIPNQITGYLKQLEALDNPRAHGKALPSPTGRTWESFHPLVRVSFLKGRPLISDSKQS